jgi:hypothetical protein
VESSIGSAVHHQSEMQSHPNFCANERSLLFPLGVFIHLLLVCCVVGGTYIKGALETPECKMRETLTLSERVAVASLAATTEAQHKGVSKDSSDRFDFTSLGALQKKYMALSQKVPQKSGCGQADSCICLCARGSSRGSKRSIIPSPPPRM